MVFVFTLGSGVTIFKKVFTYLRNLMSGTGKRESLRIRGPAGIATVIRKKSVYYTYKQKQKRKVDQVSSDYALRPFPNQEWVK